MPPRDYLGYPPTYRRELRGTVGCVLGCLPFALMPGAAAVVYFYELTERWKPFDFVRFVASAAVFFICLMILAEAFRPPRLYMSFDPPVKPHRFSNPLPAMTGSWSRLEILAFRAEAAPLSECALLEPGREWHDPAPALETVRVLQRALALRPSDDGADLAGELQLLEDALIKAAEAGARFQLVLFTF